MSAVGTIAKNTFNKVFKNLATEFGVQPSSVQLGIAYENGKQKYEAYKEMKKEKDIDIGDYVGSVIDFSGGTAVIESTIAQAGGRYAKEFSSGIDDVKVVMAYNEGKMPIAALMVGGIKKRMVDIEKEFLT